MQYPFSCVPHVADSIEIAISKPRLRRYLRAANGDRNFALRMYVWNARLCGALYLSLQLAEICARNAIHDALLSTYGSDWRRSGAFLCNLPTRLRSELETVEREEHAALGAKLTENDIVAGLSYGFWVHLMSRPFGHLLWKKGIHGHFAFAPQGVGRREIHARLDALRAFRNRIAHHYAIFDKAPVAADRHALELIGWICPETHWFANQLSEVSRIVNQRPRV